MSLRPRQRQEASCAILGGFPAKSTPGYHVTNSIREAIEQILFRRATPHVEAQGIRRLVLEHGSRPVLQEIESIEAEEKASGRPAKHLERSVERALAAKVRSEQLASAEPPSIREPQEINGSGKLWRREDGALVREVLFDDGSRYVVFATGSDDEKKAKELGL